MAIVNRLTGWYMCVLVVVVVVVVFGCCGSDGRCRGTIGGSDIIRRRRLMIRVRVSGCIEIDAILLTVVVVVLLSGHLSLHVLILVITVVCTIVLMGIVIMLMLMFLVVVLVMMIQCFRTDQSGCRRCFDATVYHVVRL